MGTTHALSDSEEEVIFNPFEAYFNIGRHLLFRKDYKRALVYLDKSSRLVSSVAAAEEEQSMPSPPATPLPGPAMPTPLHTKNKLRRRQYVVVVTREFDCAANNFPLAQLRRACKCKRRVGTSSKPAQGIEPKHVGCLLMRSTCHLYITNNDESIELAKAAHAITKRNPHAILLIAEGYYRKGEFEMALKYFINDDVDPKLWPEMNLTDYYSYAFPPKNASNSQKPNLQKVTIDEESMADAKKSTEKWPEMMPAETLRKVFDKKYSEYLYIHELYRVEGRQPSAVWYYNLDDTYLTIGIVVVHGASTVLIPPINAFVSCLQQAAITSGDSGIKDVISVN
eukprot:TsM_000831100 transcript=TsM_000831100 gene=TsM_000831100